MNPLDYARPSSAAQAVELVAGDPDAMFLAGGSNLIDHLKLGIVAPSRLVDVSGLGLDTVEETPEGGLRVGATVRNSDLAAHPWILTHQPVLARALLAGASGQIRNQATTGGNLLQRTRCVYFQDATTPCNKRTPGSGCSADDERAHTKDNAILGSSEHCRATYPGDMAVALAALDAVVIVQGPGGERRVALDDFYRLPGDAPEKDTTLAHGELITAVEIPAPIEGAAQGYEKVRERTSYAFALASVAAVLRMDGDTVADLRVAWGGIAHRPWRARTLESALLGKELTEQAVRDACAAELTETTTWEGNAAIPAIVTGATAKTLLRLADEQTPGQDRDEQEVRA
ncbi:FAD binding domain-containing protein [Mobilicoccus pelagius]|uniref:Putative oxidoreductase FAD-binding subunit n=1 Tax=Mobilicoccus pelagius NBRC 104925 TaxID=1089455 RepID=H5URI7_9MICO|nr:xanthine dehydrogenase family protein subunit M [Mobilicoccus pelagius]GAB48345.1 putative oxidoreductase FAD-binding subunit [Mobilicoccus pelagius NBRC 104925]